MICSSSAPAARSTRSPRARATVERRLVQPGLAHPGVTVDQERTAELTLGAVEQSV